MSKTFPFQTIQFSQKILFQTIQFSISIVFVYTQLIVRTVLFQIIQFRLTAVSKSKTVPVQTIQLSISMLCCLNVKTVLFQAIQFSIITQFSSIWPIDRTLSGVKSDGNKGVFCIPQSSSITGTSPSDCLVLYPGHSLGVGLTPLQKCSRCILQPQPTGQTILKLKIYIVIYKVFLLNKNILYTISWFKMTNLTIIIYL